MNPVKIFFFFLFLLGANKSFGQPRVIVDFNKDWKFFPGNDSTAINDGFDDNRWRLLNLPHDWSIEGEFAKDDPTTTQEAALPAGVGWYRKTFVLPASAKDRNINIEFDGVYRNSEVWINGHWLGKRPYGYSSFSYDLTAYLRAAPDKNIIAVKVDNSGQPNSRWYTGSGIYRNVRLISRNKISVAHWGTQVITKLVNNDEGGKSSINNEKVAVVNVHTAIDNNKQGISNITVVNSVFDQHDQLVIQSKPLAVAVTYPYGSEAVATVTLTQPQLWSVDNPVLYRVVTEIFEGNTKIDSYTTAFGIRECYFDVDKGFFLNGKPLKIKGVCNHHDLGALGAAVNVRAIERQLQILKAMGCNAIRTAHNPASPELLNLCDEMGFLVMEEAFDMWKKKKNKYDYSLDFDQWHERDIKDMVLRDRNHPCIFIWSIGNEIREQFDSSGINIAKELVQAIKSVDNTRPVTSALSEWNPEKNFIYKSGALDVVGLNYHQEVYEDFQKHFPGKIFLGAENMSAFATRGHYDMPSDSSYFWPAKSPQKIVEKGNSDFTVSAYDQVAAYWGSTHELTWKIIKKHDFLSGLFVWSGFDFLGEPIPYPWPARSSYYGIIDLAGFPKDVYYMYQSEWTNKPVLHIFPHWNWKPGQLVDVWAYYNQADEVELLLNGKSLGIKKKMGEDLHVMWRVPFKPGTLKAVSRKNGKIVLTKEVHTAGVPAKLTLTADREIIHADGKDLSYVTVKVLDAAGNLVPDADNNIEWSIEGAGEIVATDNGYEADLTSFKSKERRCWKGMGLAIIQSAGKLGKIIIKAKSMGLPPVRISVNAVSN